MVPIVLAGCTVAASGTTDADETTGDDTATKDEDASDGIMETGDASAGEDGASGTGDVGTGDGTDDDGGETGTDGGGDQGGSEGSPGCGSPSLGPGMHTDIVVDVEGTLREYDLFVPTGYDPDTPAPLVLNFHGLTQTSGQLVPFSRFNEAAEPRGMLVAYPQGIGNSFNAGVCCGEASANDVDDVGFARALVAQVSSLHCVDPQRVHVAGMSNGGHMAHTLACEAADIFASAASVTGVLGVPCTPARAISMIDFHGTGDLIVPYGGGGPGYPPVDEMMSDWAARNGCEPQSQVVLTQGDAVCETWPGCDDDVEVTLCTLEHGHCWPGGGPCFYGTKSDAIDASEMIAEMFTSQPMP